MIRPRWQQIGDHGEQRGFLATVLGGRTGEGGADLAVQRTAQPQAAGLIEERRHLRGMRPKRVGVPMMMAS